MLEIGFILVDLLKSANIFDCTVLSGIAVYLAASMNKQFCNGMQILYGQS